MWTFPLLALALFLRRINRHHSVRLVLAWQGKLSVEPPSLSDALVALIFVIVESLAWAGLATYLLKSGILLGIFA